MATTALWKQPYHVGRRFLAKNWLNLNFKVTIIGVTGSFGKTNTCRAIADVLSQNAPTLQTDLNLDTVYNLPITILKLRPRHKFLVLEMGVDHKGEMGSYLKYVRPSIAVVTGITPVHSDPGLLGSLEGIMEEKGKLLESLPKDGWAILNKDDQHVRKMAEKTKARILWYGTGKNCDFWADDIQADFSGTSFTLHFDHSNNRSVEVKMGLIGKHFVHAALIAAVMGWINGLTDEEILKGLAKLEPLPGRLSVENGPRETILLDDHLRANPASTLAGLETLAILPCQGRKIAILGEMGELGGYKEEEHKKIGKAVAALKIDFLVGVGPLQKLTCEMALKEGMKEGQVFWAKDVFQAAEILGKLIKKSDLLYLKGSLKKHLERIILLLKGENVSCFLVSCDYYHQCPACSNLRKKI